MTVRLPSSTHPNDESGRKTWVRAVYDALGGLVSGKQDSHANLTSIAGLDLTGNSGDAIVVKATEDGFELAAGGGGGTTTNALTINNGGAGAASGATFDGSAPITISYNTIGAQVAGSYLTGNQTITLSGDVTGSGATAITATLATVNANVGSFGSATAIPVITVNGKGLVTAVTTATVTGRQWALVGVGQTAAGVWDQAVDGSKANVDFTGLAGYTDILIVADAVTKSVSGLISLTVSVDNGSTFFTTSGDYVVVDGNGSRTATTSVALHATNATLARNGMARIVGANVSAPKMIEQLNNPQASRLFVASNSAINAVRINGSAGGNLTGGKIYCFAR